MGAGIAVDRGQWTVDSENALRAGRENMNLKVLSFGGGVQSTTLALMAMSGEFERPDLILFADTGNESAATYEHVNNVRRAAEDNGLEFVRVSRGNIIHDVLAASHPASGIKTGQVGQPPFYVAGNNTRIEGKLWRKCSRQYKIDPMREYVRRRLGVEKGRKMPDGITVEKWIGISIDEASRMKPSPDKWELVRWPLIEMNMTRWDCHIWLKKAGWGVIPKSACLICPYHDNTYWRELRDDSPEEFESVVAFEEELHRGRIPGTKSAAYVHRSCVPLKDVDLSTDEDRGQMALSLWAGECEGICGT